MMVVGKLPGGRRVMKIARWGMAFWLAIPAVAAAAPQSQTASTSADQQTASSPLVAAARRTREQKKDQPKPAHVWDNDTIPTIPGAVNVVGQAPAPADSSAGADNSAGAPAATQPAPGEDKATLLREAGDAKDHLQSLQVDLDLLQRTYTLDQSSYYGKTDFQNDSAGAAKLKDEQAKIDAKQQEIAAAEKEVEDLQARANAASDAKPADAAAPATPPPASDNSAGAGDNSSGAAAPPASDTPSSSGGGSVPNN
jgi:hypothetical protein